MWTKAFTDMGPPVLVEGAGHWVQQEQPQAVTAALLAFLGRVLQMQRADNRHRPIHRQLMRNIYAVLGPDN